MIRGATALLARKMSVRHTIDIDIYRAGAIADVERQLREAAALDIGDWMRFEFGPSTIAQASGAQAARFKVRSLQMRAVTKEARRRSLQLPPRFAVPDQDLWERGYRAEARRTVGLDALELEAAMAVVRPFLDPLLAGTATGKWEPGAQAWIEGAQ